MNMKLASIGRLALRALGLSGLAAGLSLALSAPASAQTDIVPYLEVEQVLSADLNEGDTLTYTSVAAGVDATTQTSRVQGQVSYRYERRIAWQDDIAEDDMHSGLAQVRAELVPNTLSLNAGALAARARTDAGGPIFGFGGADSRDQADVYSVYAGPDFTTHVGALSVGASYRLGYVKIDDHSLAGAPVPPGAVPDRYDSSTNHNLTASVGMAPGRGLPVGWTVGAGYVREDVDRLDQRFEGMYVRGDVVVPVSPTLAVTAGVGYEKSEASQQDFRRDSNGAPILTPGGNLIADPSRPRLLAYEQDGVIWDAGVIWRPSRRTELQARYGRRYGDHTFVGSFRHDLNSAYSITGSVYDSVDSFGRIITKDLSNLPTKFRVNRNPLNPGVGVGGCVFGAKPGTGACFDDALRSLSSANFRHRGAQLVFSGGRGPWSFGVGGGYAQRKYLTPEPVGNFSFARAKEESVTVAANIGREFTRSSGINFDAYASWYDTDEPGFGSSTGYGITADYYHSFLWEQLEAHAAVGLYTTSSEDIDSTVAQALLGLRYSF